ncbi:fucosyl transferase [Necator americanus]|uniref:Fucosyltransferase n=1 Tax=Necator americanus TaxID=51031 RepID=W2TLW6_NECAM|nr:fucosyl transferase [Necator americanus]ETN83105.1 fucosyl transferase [Necator americanus]
MLQIDAFASKYPHLAKIDDIDISLLSRYLYTEEEVQDEDVPWTIDYLLASLSSEMREEIGHRFEKLAPKRIVLWTTVFGETKSVDFSDCKGFSDRCIVTSNKSLAPVADAVVFHARDIPNAPLPEPYLRRPHQRYVFLTMETPSNSGRHAVPCSFKLPSIITNFFNWTATYLLSSDVVFKYGLFYLSAKEAELKGFKFVNFHIDESALIKKKSGIFGIISNCKTLAGRELAIKELSRYINVTIGGKCAMNENYLNLCPSGNSCSELYEQYPFYFAVENSVCKDYVTEKYWDRTSFASIPIVMRRKIYESSNMPPHSFIAMDDYNSPKEMAENLRKIESDNVIDVVQWMASPRLGQSDVVLKLSVLHQQIFNGRIRCKSYKRAYEEYFTWRKGQWTAAPWNAPGYRNGFCRLCERLWEENPQEKTVRDVDKIDVEKWKVEET